MVGFRQREEMGRTSDLVCLWGECMYMILALDLESVLCHVGGKSLPLAGKWGFHCCSRISSLIKLVVLTPAKGWRGNGERERLSQQHILGLSGYGELILVMLCGLHSSGCLLVD